MEEMKPGIELDRAVAEQVMGWTEIEVGKAMGTGQDTLQGVRPGQLAYGNGYKPKFQVPHYSWDISAAWQVVEKLRTREVAFSMHSLKDNTQVFVEGHPPEPRWEWIAKFEWIEDRAYRFEFEHHPNVATAICLAALKVGRE